MPAISLDKVTADPYFGLSVDQHGIEIQNQIENCVQILGGQDRATCFKIKRMAISLVIRMTIFLIISLANSVIF